MFPKVLVEKKAALKVLPKEGGSPQGRGGVRPWPPASPRRDQGPKPRNGTLQPTTALSPLTSAEQANTGRAIGGRTSRRGPSGDNYSSLVCLSCVQ
jgi:hypothetical protein